MILCLELTFTHKVLVWIPKHIGDFTDLFPGHFLRKLNLTTVSSVAQMEGVYGNTYVCWCIPKHNTCNASLALTLYISSSYSKKTVMAGCCFALTAVFRLIEQRSSWMGGTFSLWWCARREKSGISCSERLFWWFLGIINDRQLKFSVHWKNPIRPIFLFSICKSEKVTEVQSVLKTDQRADLSAHAFFSAHGCERQLQTK